MTLPLRFAIVALVALLVIGWWFARPTELSVRVEASAVAVAPRSRVSFEHDGVVRQLWPMEPGGDSSVDKWLGPVAIRGRGAVNLHVVARDSLLVTEATIPLAMRGGDGWDVTLSAGRRPASVPRQGGITWIALRDTLWVRWARGEVR